MTDSSLRVWHSCTVLRAQDTWAPKEMALQPTSLWICVLGQTINFIWWWLASLIVNKYKDQTYSQRCALGDFRPWWTLETCTFEILSCDNPFSDYNFRSTSWHSWIPWVSQSPHCSSTRHSLLVYFLGHTSYHVTILPATCTFLLLGKTPRQLMEGRVYLVFTV